MKICDMIQPHKVSMTLFVIMSPAFTSPPLSILCIPYSEDIERVVFGAWFELCQQSVGALGELLINYMDSGISLGRF